MREQDAEATFVEAPGRREREREREGERVDGEIRRERKAGILKAAVTPVTSHLSNPAPT